MTIYKIEEEHLNAYIEMSKKENLKKPIDEYNKSLEDDSPTVPLPITEVIGAKVKQTIDKSLEKVFPKKLDSTWKNRYRDIAKELYGKMLEKIEVSSKVKDYVTEKRQEMVQKWINFKESFKQKFNIMSKLKGGITNKLMAWKHMSRLEKIEKALQALIVVWSITLLLLKTSLGKLVILAAKVVKETGKAFIELGKVLTGNTVDIILQSLEGAMAEISFELQDFSYDFFTVLCGEDPRGKTRDQKKNAGDFAIMVILALLPALWSNRLLVGTLLYTAILQEFLDIILHPLNFIKRFLFGADVPNVYDSVADAAKALKEKYLAEHSIKVSQLVILNDEDEETKAIKNAYNVSQEVKRMGMTSSGRFEETVTENGIYLTYNPTPTERLKKICDNVEAVAMSVTPMGMISNAVNYMAKKAGLIDASNENVLKKLSRGVGNFFLGDTKNTKQPKGEPPLDFKHATAQVVAELQQKGLNVSNVTDEVLKERYKQLTGNMPNSAQIKAFKESVKAGMFAMDRLRRVRIASMHKAIGNHAKTMEEVINVKLFKNMHDQSSVMLSFLQGSYDFLTHFAQRVFEFCGWYDTEDYTHPSSVYNMWYYVQTAARVTLGSIAENFESTPFVFIPKQPVMNESEEGKDIQGEENLTREQTIKRRVESRAKAQTMDTSNINVLDLRGGKSVITSLNGVIRDTLIKKEILMRSVTQKWRERRTLIEAIFMYGNIRTVDSLERK